MVVARHGVILCVLRGADCIVLSNLIIDYGRSCVDHD